MGLLRRATVASTLLFISASHYWALPLSAGRSSTGCRKAQLGNGASIAGQRSEDGCGPYTRAARQVVVITQAAPLFIQPRVQGSRPHEQTRGTVLPVI